MTDVVHKSAHPNLPPAAPQQVVQYLLAKNFHLTALELLVEAQQSGHGEDVRDLEAFFSDSDRFPPEDLARHQPDNAFDLQAAGRERESRLQLAEYELRLAKEDLAEMARKLAQAQERQQQQQQQQQQLPYTSNGAAAALPAAASIGPGSAGASPFSPNVAPPSPGPPGSGPGSGPVLVAGSGAAPTPPEQRALNAAVFAHLLRQGLVTTAMTMEEEYGGPLRPIGSLSSSTHGSATHGTADTEQQPWELWSWYRAAAARGTSTDAAATPSAAEAAGGGGASAALVGAAVDPEDLIRQYGLLGPDPNADLNLGMAAEPAGSGLADSSASGNVNGGQPPPPPLLESEEDGARRLLLSELAAAREELAATRARARAAVAAAVEAATAAAAPKQQPKQPQQQTQSVSPSRQSLAQQPLSFISADASVLDLLDLGSSVVSGQQTAPGAAAATAAAVAAADAAAAAPGSGPDVASASRPAGRSSESLLEPNGGRSAPAPSPSAGASGAEERSAAASHGPADEEQAPPWRRIDPAYHASLEGLLTGLCDMLPRLVPNLNVKSRLDALPLIVAAAKTTSDWEVRRQLLAAVFNLTPAPDHQQRQAIIDASLELCQAFGSGWAANELVQLCCRQASSPSSERRTLVAEALGEAVGTVDPGTQAHVLLTQLSQLAKDRMEQVREAACHSLARLVPRLPFTRSYYTTLEGLLLPLATDASEAVHVASLSYLVPALLTWQPQEMDSVLLVSSCLARVLAEMGQQVRLIEHYQQHFFQQQQQQQLQRQPQPPDGPAAAASSNTFTGSFLRYSQATPASPAPSQPPHPPPSPHPLQQRPSEDQTAAGARGFSSSSSSLHDLPGAGPQSAAAAPSPLAAPSPPPPPPPQWVTFGRRSFPSSSHVLLYQLLALYGGLTPALRHAALRSRPSWACPAGSDSGTGGSAAASNTTSRPQTPVAAAAAAAGGGGLTGGRRPHRAGSFGESSSAATAATRPGAAAAIDPSDLLSATHRRTSSHPAFGAVLAPLVPGGGGGFGGGGGGFYQSSILTAHISLQTPEPSSLHQLLGQLPKSSSSSALGNLDGAYGSRGTAEEAPARSGSGEAPEGPGGGGGGGGGEEEGPLARSQWSRADGEVEEGGGEAAVEDQGRAEEDASLAAWALHAQHTSWKTLEWVVQHVVPELIRLVCCVGPMFPEALDVRRQAAGAVAATCSALGAAFTQSVMEPVFLVASGAGAATTGVAGSGGGGGGGGGAAPAGVIVADFEAPLAVRDICAAVQPRTPEALRMARDRVSTDARMEAD